uniref:Methyltransf_21 domain-containing protein n=1 Tax=Globodera pallida TaxID=36090 RepID=A0A183BTY4_GLOPA
MEVIKLLADGDEYKYFISFLPNAAKYLPCTVITLGVGHTVDAERNLINLYPECRLIAADPSAEINANLTREIGGTFVHAAVGGKTATKQPEQVNAERHPVDLLMIDIEGAEFGIFEQLAFHYELFPTPICQINIEVHDPDTLFANYTHQQFFRSLDTLLRSGRFALMNTDMFTKQAPLHLFLRMFFVNIVEERCTRKFIC